VAIETRRADRPSGFQPVHLGHLHIHQDQIVGAPVALGVEHGLDRLAAILCKFAFVSGLVDHRHGQFLVHRIVLGQLKIKIGDVVAGSDIRNRATVIQQKTNRPVQFELTADVRATLLAWLERRGGSAGDYLFPSKVDHAGHMSTRQFARHVDEWVTAIGLRKSEYGTHSLRRTKAAMIYRATGNVRAIPILLGHTKIENTVRYLGVDVEYALLLAERTEI